MVDAIELSVVGGPSTVNVSVDLGATGQRGSMFYTLAGSPLVLTSTVSQLVPAVQDMDLILNSSTGVIFQLVPGISGSVWTPIFDIDGGS
jgi:hypothetical protein